MPKLDFIPDISFVPCSLDTLIDQMIAAYKSEYNKQTGERIAVELSSPERVTLQTMAYMIYQAFERLDFVGKQNFIKYAEGGYLENLGAMVMVTRLKPKAAMVRIQFNLSAPQPDVVTIPKGTRVSPGNNVFFSTLTETVIPAGDNGADAIAMCTKTGTVGNGFSAGSINILVDPVAYVKHAVSVETSQGGADIENDDSLRMRIYMKPSSFSVAGPIEAYRYFAHEFSQNILDCNVVSPVPGEVIMVVVLQGGEIPQSAFLAELTDFVEIKRPLTDKLTIKPPQPVTYDIDFTYYLPKDYRNGADYAEENIRIATDSFISWQKSKIGRDINPSELIRRLMETGIKRVDIAKPAHTVLEYDKLAVEGTVTMNFGGYEDE